MNNNDKISNMTIEEKAELLNSMVIGCLHCPVNCKKPHINQKKRCLNSTIKWLQQEATSANI